METVSNRRVIRRDISAAATYPSRCDVFATCDIFIAVRRFHHTWRFRHMLRICSAVHTPGPGGAIGSTSADGAPSAALLWTPPAALLTHPHSAALLTAPTSIQPSPSTLGCPEAPLGPVYSTSTVRLLGSEIGGSRAKSLIRKANGRSVCSSTRLVTF